MPSATCTRNCSIAAAVLGLVVWIFTAGFGDLRWFEGLFLALVGAGLFWIFLKWLVCDGAPAEDGSAWHPGAPAPAAAATSDVTPRGLASEAAMGFLGSAEGAEPHPVTPGGDAQVASNGKRSESTRNDIYGSANAPADEAPKPEPKAEEAKPAAKKPAPKAEKPAPKADAEPDDLKQIKGVGPKLEETLHENGVTRFDQIAAWTDEDVDRFAEIIGRMGSRIRSDDWVEQAKVLAAGGETEFSKRVEEGDVYE